MKKKIVWSTIGAICLGMVIVVLYHNEVEGDIILRGIAGFCSAIALYIAVNKQCDDVHDEQKKHIIFYENDFLYNFY